MISLARASLLILTIAAFAHAEGGFQADPKAAPVGTPTAVEPVAPVKVGPVTIAPDPRAVESGLFIRVHKPAEKASVSFTVTEPAGVARKRCPVRGSLPFYRGELTDPKNIRLLDDAGQEVPVQGLAASVWPEGSMKFLCLDFLIDLDANQTREFTLEFGTQVSSKLKSALQVMRGNVAGFGVDTSVITVWFTPGERFCSPVKIDGRDATHEDMTGRLLVSEGDPTGEMKSYPLIVDEVKVVEQGPVQATVYLGGSYGTEKTATALGWEKGVPRYVFHGFVRLYADSARMDIIHSFGYNGDENSDFVRRYGLVIPTTTVNGTFIYGGDDGKVAQAKLDGLLRLTQSAHDRWTLSGKSQATGKRFGGWAAMTGNGASCVVALREAWQQWPVTFEADEKGYFIADIYGAGDNQFLDLRYKGDGFDPKTGAGFHRSKSMWTGDRFSTAYTGGLGAQHRAMGLLKISELTIDFTPGADPASIGNGEHTMLIPWAGSKRFTDTRVFGLTGYYDPADERQLRARDYYDILLDFPWAAHLANGLFGWVDWPDAPDLDPPKGQQFGTNIFGGGRGWTNGERQALAYFGQYVAAGWRRAFDIGHQTVLHTIGFDIEHPGGDNRHGMCHRHNQVHWGDEGGPRQAAWRGWYAHYWLTGHPEVMRSLKELHGGPLGVNALSTRAKWPWHSTTPPEQMEIKDDQDVLYVGGSECTPFHTMNLARWETTGEEKFARHNDFLMEEWRRNIEEGVTVNVRTGQFQGAAADVKPMDLDHPETPKYASYYWGTYGGAMLISDWAQLAGSSRAVDVILTFGDYHATDDRGADRIDVKNGPGGKPDQLYRTYEGIIPAYALLRAKTHPDYVERWKNAMAWRLFEYPYGGTPKKLKPGAKPQADPEDYAANNWANTGAWCFGENGPKIYAAQAWEALYTLWLLNREK